MIPVQYHVYVIKSAATGRLYKGSTQDLERRLRQHNSSHTRSTKSGKPWVLVHVEHFETRAEARTREKYFKSYRGALELRDILAAPAG